MNKKFKDALLAFIAFMSFMAPMIMAGYEASIDEEAAIVSLPE